MGRCRSWNWPARKQRASGPVKSGPFGRAEDLDQAIRDHLILAVFELPDSESEVARVPRMAMAAAATLTGRGTVRRRIRITSAHAARARTHAADSNRPGVRQLLHDLRAGDLELGRI